MGNRTQQVEDGTTTTYTYNSTNELTQCTGATYTWDDRGNLIGKVQGGETWVYTYDLANRLTQVTRQGTVLGTYAYDASGMRAKKVEGGATTHYLTLGHQVMYEKTQGPDSLVDPVSTRHIFAGSQRIAEVTNGTTRYFHNDHLGSPRAVTSATGSVIAEVVATTPFGTPHATSALTSYMFTGKDRDTTGLYYFAARYYNPAVGRFVTEDTWEGRLHQPASQNRYVYVENNPLRYVDPTGHMPELTPEGGGSGGFVEVVIWGLTRALEAGKKVVGEVCNFVHNTVIGKAAPAASKAAEPFVKAGQPYLQQVSDAANTAADTISQYTVKGYHLMSGSGGRSKFATDSLQQVQVWLQQGLRSPDALFMPNGESLDTFQVFIDMGQVVGTKGQQFLKVVIDEVGRIITSYPVRGLP